MCIHLLTIPSGTQNELTSCDVECWNPRLSLEVIRKPLTVDKAFSRDFTDIGTLRQSVQ